MKNQQGPHTHYYHQLQLQLHHTTNSAMTYFCRYVSVCSSPVSQADIRSVLELDQQLPLVSVQSVKLCTSHFNQHTCSASLTAGHLSLKCGHWPPHPHSLHTHDAKHYSNRLACFLQGHVQYIHHQQ